MKIENELVIQRAELRIIRWMCGVKITDSSRVVSWEKPGIDYITTVIQRYRLRWYGHVLRKDKNDGVKKCVDYEVEGVRPRGKPKKTWIEVTEKDCQTWQICKEDAVDRSKWRKLIKDVV